MQELHHTGTDNTKVRWNEACVCVRQMLRAAETACRGEKRDTNWVCLMSNQNGLTKVFLSFTVTSALVDRVVT